MTTKTILLINNEPSLCEVVKACLSDLAGWNVLTADSTLEGLQQADLNQPDAIILAISMIKMDGFVALEQLRSHPAIEKIPIILLTSTAKWLDSQRLQRYQVTGVIANPFDPGIFRDQLANLLGWKLQIVTDDSDGNTTMNASY